MFKTGSIFYSTEPERERVPNSRKEVYSKKENRIQKYTPRKRIESKSISLGTLPRWTIGGVGVQFV